MAVIREYTTKSLTQQEVIEDSFRYYIECGNIVATAKQFNITRKTFYAWLKKHSALYDQLLRESMGSAAAEAFNIILRLAQTSPNQQVRLQAAKDILNRSGYAPVEKKELAISGLKEEEIEHELRKLLRLDEDSDQ